LHLATRAGDIVIFDLRIRHAGVFPNRAERLITAFAWWLHRLRLVDDAGRHRLIWRLRHPLEPGHPAERLAIFLAFATAEDVARRFAAFCEASEAEVAEASA
jgi:hypothetical protein